MDDLVFTVNTRSAPPLWMEQWDVYTIFEAYTIYKDVKYMAWGTDEEEAKKKCVDLIKLDKVNGIVRNPGDVVE